MKIASWHWKWSLTWKRILSYTHKRNKYHRMLVAEDTRSKKIRRIEKIKSLRGKYCTVLTPSNEFALQKDNEIEIEGA